MGRLGISEIFIFIIILAGIAFFISKSSNSSAKSSSVAYLLWLFSGFGVLGFHRFYLGKIGTGLLWFFTGGLLGFGAFFDLFTLGGQVDRYNTTVELSTIRATTLSNTQQINSTFSNPVQPTQEGVDAISATKSHQEKIELLQNLKDLLDKGILTQDEFNQQKAQVLS